MVEAGHLQFKRWPQLRQAFAGCFGRRGEADLKHAARARQKPLRKLARRRADAPRGHKECGAQMNLPWPRGGAVDVKRLDLGAFAFRAGGRCRFMTSVPCSGSEDRN